MSKPPWQKFRVGTPSTRPNWTEPDCQPLTSVAHVAHVPVALRIVEDRRLRADLVFDKSRLNTERIRVVWLSPNDWGGAGGFRYGNIRYHFDWDALIAGKRAFWVESIAYGIEACRILLTDVNYAGTLDVYDPAAGDGPWWLSPSGDHYWNGNYCLEVMVEGDLDLGRATEVDFVDHHENRCSIDYRTCPYRGTSRREGGARFLAALVSRQSKLDLPGLVIDNGQGPGPSWALESAANLLLARIAKTATTPGGTLARSDPAARALARAVLAAYANQGIDGDAETLAAQFASSSEVAGAVADALAAAVGLSSGAAFGV